MNGISVDTVNLDVRVNAADGMAFNGHLLQLTEDGVGVVCPVCGKQSKTNTEIDSIHRWELILYHIGCLGDCNEGENLEDRLERVLDDYVGEQATDSMLADIEDDMRNIVGQKVPIKVHAP